MKKLFYLFGIASLILLLGACGGDSGPSVSEIQGAPEQVYQATLPDGTVMLMTIEQNGGSEWFGEFSMDTDTGPYADQGGMIAGTLNGTAVSANCETFTGSTFTLSGTSQSGGFQMTRSDIPGTTLNFTVVLPPIKSSLATTTFVLVSDSGNVPNQYYGRVELSTQPTFQNANFAQYSGTFSSKLDYVGKVGFSAYSDGTAILEVELGPGNTLGMLFPNYRITDITSKKVAAAIAIDFIYLNGNTNNYIDTRFGATARPPYF